MTKCMKRQCDQHFHNKDTSKAKISFCYYRHLLNTTMPQFNATTDALNSSDKFWVSSTLSEISILFKVNVMNALVLTLTFYELMNKSAVPSTL